MADTPACRDAARSGARTAAGKNPGRSRAHNRRVILDLLRRHGQLRRRELAEMMQLSPQAIANILDELADENLLVRRERLRGGRGQPPLQYAINPRGAFTVGIELAVTQMVVTAVDLGGTPQRQAVTSLDDNGPDAVLPLIVAQVKQLDRELAGALLGIGLVMPGPFEIEGLSGVGPTTLPGWAGMDVAAILNQLLGVPATVENDANAAALGESLLGAARELSHFCVLYFGTGIGLGLIVDGTPMRGAFGNAGEVGHIVVAPGGRPCPCGQAGCLECYASLHALRERLAACGRPTGFDDLAALHAAGDPNLAEWVVDAARHLSPMIAMLENVLDPESVVLAGGLPAAVLDAIIARLALAPSVASRGDRSVARVLRGHTGQTTAALGAAALPLHDAITPRLDLAEDPPAAAKGGTP